MLTYATFWWTMLWQFLSVLILGWILFRGALTPEWWFKYNYIREVVVGLVLSVITTVWFTGGVGRDLWDLVKTLKTVKRVDADDGTVGAHPNLKESGRSPVGTEVREQSCAPVPNP